MWVINLPWKSFSKKKNTITNYILIVYELSNFDHVARCYVTDKSPWRQSKPRPSRIESSTLPKWLSSRISLYIPAIIYSIGSAKYLFFGKCFIKNLLNIFSNFFFYLKVPSFQLIMENNFIQMAASAWPCSSLHDRSNFKHIDCVQLYFNNNYLQIIRVIFVIEIFKPRLLFSNIPHLHPRLNEVH